MDFSMIYELNYTLVAGKEALNRECAGQPVGVSDTIQLWQDPSTMNGRQYVISR
jgi:hypothetical protein